MTDVGLGNVNGDDLSERVTESNRQQAAFIHAKAHVERATIGARTRVWQFASVIRHAEIGEDCNIASCAIVDGARVGSRTLISHGAFIDPGTWIGDECFIGPGVKLCNDAWPRADKDGFDMELLLSGQFITTRIEDGASLGAGVIVLPGTIVGASAMVAAGAVVDRNVKPGHLYKRDGTMVPIDARSIQRMRQAHR